MFYSKVEKKRVLAGVFYCINKKALPPFKNTSSRNEELIVDTNVFRKHCFLQIDNIDEKILFIKRLYNKHSY